MNTSLRTAHLSPREMSAADIAELATAPYVALLPPVEGFGNADDVAAFKYQREIHFQRVSAIKAEHEYRVANPGKRERELALEARVRAAYSSRAGQQ